MLLLLHPHADGRDVGVVGVGRLSVEDVVLVKHSFTVQHDGFGEQFFFVENFRW